MLKKISIHYLYLMSSFIFLSSCVDKLPSTGSESFCPGKRLADNSCPYASSSLSKSNVNFTDVDMFSYSSDVFMATNKGIHFKEFSLSHKNSNFSKGVSRGTLVTENGELSLNSKLDDSLRIDQILSKYNSSLLGYWRMDNSANVSAGSLSTVVNGDTHFSINSKIGSHALSIDGNGDYLTVTSGNYSQFSVSMWVKYTDLSVVRALVDGGGDFWLDSYVNNGGFPYIWSRNSDLVQTRITSSKAIKENVWAHVSFVLGASGRKIYVDGELAASDMHNIATGRIQTIGKVSSLYGLGLIDEVAIWNLEISTEDVASLYKKQSQLFSDEQELNIGWTPKWDKLLGYWQFDDNLLDSSHKNNHLGSLSNDAQIVSDAKVNSGALSLDGSHDYIRVTDNLNDDIKSKGSVSFWLKNNIDDWTGVTSRYVFRTYYDSNDGFGLRFLSSGGFLFSFTGGGDYQGVSVPEASKVFPVGAWKFVTATWDTISDNRLRLYVDGVEVANISQNNAMTGNLNFGYIGYSNESCFKGSVDEFALWNEALEPEDILTIYHKQKQRFSGEYTSKIIDIGRSGKWSELSSKTSLPYLKELSPSSESSNDYPNLKGSLASGLIGYWPFNEKALNTLPDNEDYADYSGNGYHAKSFNGLTPGKKGKFNEAISLDGSTGAGTVTHNNIHNMNGEITISSWVNLNEIDSTTNFGDFIVGKGNWNSNDNYNLVFYNGALRCSYGRTWSGAIVYPDSNFKPGRWYHLVCQADASGHRLFVNGVLVQSIATAPSQIPTNTVPITFGAWPGGYGTANLNGRLDEVAIWNRSISLDEVRQLYLRGANRVKYQVRSCSDSLCVSNQFIGPDGTNKTYFSELSNNTIINSSTGASEGVQKSGAAHFVFDDFVSALTDNRFFQYKVFLESEEENKICNTSYCLPLVEEISLKPKQRFYGGEGEITSSRGIDYNVVTGIDILEFGDCDISYRVSSNGSDYYYWHEGSWIASDSKLKSNNKNELNSNIKSYTKMKGRGKLFFKIGLKNNSFNSCGIEKMTLVHYK